jgi:hypothetical protein
MGFPTPTSLATALGICLPAHQAAPEPQTSVLAGLGAVVRWQTAKFQLFDMIDLQTSTNFSGSSGVNPMRLMNPDFFVSKTWRFKSLLSSFTPQVIPFLPLKMDGRTSIA